jgi:hypothetical protein
MGARDDVCHPDQMGTAENQDRSGNINWVEGSFATCYGESGMGSNVRAGMALVGDHNGTQTIFSQRFFHKKSSKNCPSDRDQFLVKLL